MSIKPTSREYNLTSAPFECSLLEASSVEKLSDFLITAPIWLTAIKDVCNLQDGDIISVKGQIHVIEEMEFDFDRHGRASNHRRIVVVDKHGNEVS